MIKKGLVTVLFVLLFCLKAYGNEANNTDAAEVHISVEWQSQTETSEKLFFLFSNASFTKKHTGSLILINSNASVDSEFSGNIYLFFSELNLEENAVINGRIYTLSSLVFGNFGEGLRISSLFFLGDLFEISGEDNYYTYDSRLPALVIILIVCIIRQLICAVIYGVRPAFFNQGSVLLEREPQEVVSFGLLAYFFLVSAALVFLLSVVGVAISVLILIVAFILVLCGQICLQLSLGKIIFDKLHLLKGPYLTCLLGGVVVELITLMPVVRFSANLLFIPILCLGILASNIVNGFFRRRYYETQFDYIEKINPANNLDAIRTIIEVK